MCVCEGFMIIFIIIIIFISIKQSKLIFVRANPSSRGPWFQELDILVRRCPIKE